MNEIELFVNTSSILVLFLSSVITFLLGRKIYHKNPDPSNFEKSIAFGFFIAGFGSLLAGIFRTPYIFFPEQADFWLYGSYLFFVLMAVSLSFILACGLAIFQGKETLKLGFLGVLAIVPITYAYFLSENFNTGVMVSVVPGLANTEMNTIGAILVFGSLAIIILLNVIVYLRIYLKTRNHGSLLMFLGMITFVIATLIGGLTDLLGELGRLFDPVSYFLILIGLIIIARGFTSNDE